jgi:hypothetical protein
MWDFIKNLKIKNMKIKIDLEKINAFNKLDELEQYRILESLRRRITGFTLSADKANKDRGKANYANAYIGFGVEHRRSSTGRYLEDARAAGIPVNDEIVPCKNTVAFVSVAGEGTHNDRTVALARKVIAAGGTVIMDASGTGFGQSHSPHNINGEGAVQEALGTPTGQTKEGYNVWEGKKIDFF